MALGVVAEPVLALVGLLALGFVFLGLREAARPTRVFLGLLGALLAGYAFLGRGFAYVGLPPVYVGEVVLVVGLLSVVLTGRALFAFTVSPAWLVLAFIVWGAARTAPSLATHGVAALRDAVVWGYGVFAILVAASLWGSNTLRRIPRLYGLLVPWLLVWIPVAILLRILPGLEVPTVPGTLVPIGLKAGDASFHLAGVAAFLILGLWAQDRRDGPRQSSTGEWALWIVWFVGFMIAATSRAGLMSVVAVFLFLIPLVPFGRLLKVAAVCGVLIASLLAFDFELDLGWNRVISLRQVAKSLGSLSGDETQPVGTREWRLRWWRDIVDYTFFGDYFWAGKGFGVNLADDDGYQVTPDHSLRSPHNGHLTILARGGVPGFALWVVVQTGVASAFLRGALRARRRQDPHRAALLLWVLSYWIAFMVTSFFGVFLEGPHGGIWFWSVIGFGIALLQSESAPPLRHS